MKTESRKLSFIPPGLPRFSFSLFERHRQSLACLQIQTAALTSSPRSESDYLVCSSLLWDGNSFCKTPKTLKRPDPFARGGYQRRNRSSYTGNEHHRLRRGCETRRQWAPGILREHPRSICSKPWLFKRSGGLGPGTWDLGSSGWTC